MSNQLQPVVNGKAAPSANPSAWEQVVNVLKSHYYEPDVTAARALYSAVAAHRLQGAPVWVMLVAPPGSGKTDLIKALDGQRGFHMIDSVTPQTFLSGQFKEESNRRGRPRARAADPSASPSLLQRIGSGIIAYPDFSTVLGMKHEKKATILADMRRIYDGELAKEFGTEQRPNARWKGRITFLAGVTGEIDGNYSVFNTLGERFIMIRWPRAGGIDAALVATNRNHRAVEELRLAVYVLFAGLSRLEPQIPEHLQLGIFAFSEIAMRARTHMPRDHSKKLEYVPEAESNTRLAQQLTQLAKGSALLDGRAEVDLCDVAIAVRAAFDSMPPQRAQILKTLMRGEDLSVLGGPRTTLFYAKQDLQAQNLLEGEKLSPYVKDLCEKAGFRRILDRAA